MNKDELCDRLDRVGADVSMLLKEQESNFHRQIALELLRTTIQCRAGDAFEVEPQPYSLKTRIRRKILFMLF